MQVRRHACKQVCVGALSFGVQSSLYEGYISELSWETFEGCVCGMRSAQDSVCPVQVWEYWSVVCAVLDGVCIQDASVR